MEKPSHYKVPKHLSGPSARGITVSEPIAQFEIGPYQNFVYLIVDWKQKLAAIVDPREELEEIDRALKQHSLRLEQIFLTHTHHDHIGGVSPLLERDPHLTLVVHDQDATRLPRKLQSHSRLIHAQDGNIVRLGDLEIQILHTPGHSAGECSYFINGAPPYLFTGDTIFIRDCGRTDLETGSNSDMYDSIQRVKSLSATTIILPGHHYKEECATTIGREILESPPFQCKSVEELASLP